MPGPLGVSRFAGSPTPRPGPRAGSPRSRETWPLAHAWRFETPTLRLETLKPGPNSSVPGPPERSIREGGWGEIRPAGGRSHCAGACGSRAASRGGVSLAWLSANSEGPRRGMSCSVACGGGSEGWARRPARATARSPWGKEQPHAVKKKSLAAHPLGKTKPSRGGKREHAPSPRGKGKPATEWQRRSRCGAGTDPAHSFDQVGTRPGVHGAPALSIPSWSFTRSTSRSVRSLARTPVNSSPAIS